MQNKTIKQNTNKKKRKRRGKCPNKMNETKNPQKAKQNMELILCWSTCYGPRPYLGM